MARTNASVDGHCNLTVVRAMNRPFMARALLTAALLAGGLVPAAHADRWDWHGPYRHFDHDGRWYHGDHDGRFGWWWIAGPGVWYFYSRPVWPYPRYYYEYPYEYANPPVVVVPPSQPQAAPPPPQQYWYYCAGAKAYYPYVRSCPGGWRKVPVTPPAEH